MPNIKIKTKGMHCTSCEMLIKDALGELEGINKVELSYKSGLISVDYDAKKLSKEDILKTIQKEGYETT